MFKEETLMNKFLPAVIGTGLLIAGAANAADFPAPTVYGRAHVSVGMIDDDAGSATEVSSRSSRFGMKGKYELDAGLTATYKFEFQVDVTDEAESKENHIKARNQYAGIKGSFGEIRVGRHDTAYKSATSKLDPWGDTYADYNSIIEKDFDKRADNTIIYVNKFDALGLQASYSAGTDTTAGDNDGSIFALGATYKASGLLIGGGYESIDETGSAFKIGASYNFDAFTLGGVVESVDYDEGGSADQTNIILTGAFKVSDKGTIKATYGQKDIDDLDDDPTMFAIGYNHKFNKKASAYLLAATSQDEGLADKGGLDGDGTVFALGLKYNF